MNRIWKLASVAGLIAGLTLCAPDVVTAAQGKVMTEYRGVQLGMKQADVRAKLGAPASSGEAADEFKLTGDDLMTVRYEDGSVTAIQVMILDVKNAPPFNEVVGDAAVEQLENGRRIARKVLDAQKFWVSMSQSKDASMTNITIKKM
ncbi:MAG: hypothetical protein HYR56_06740 [Acidobacteria bacterium]|nr:hypothetical protein [Acidobacteriota bacterium]MBI3426785.1 hypothetical protein [Acidobacteriota bacterium]